MSISRSIQLSEREKDALLNPIGKHDFRTLLALQRKGLASAWRKPKGYHKRRHALTIEGQRWVDDYRGSR